MFTFHEEGLFNFLCAMHQPAMAGQILVISPVRRAPTPSTKSALRFSRIDKTVVGAIEGGVTPATACVSRMWRSRSGARPSCLAVLPAFRVTNIRDDRRCRIDKGVDTVTVRNHDRNH